MNVSSVEITAGLGGFLVLFGMGLVVWFLGRDLSRRLRRMRQREELRISEVKRAADEAPASEEPASKDEVHPPADEPPKPRQE